MNHIDQSIACSLAIEHAGVEGGRGDKVTNKRLIFGVGFNDSNTPVCRYERITDARIAEALRGRFAKEE